MGVAALGYVVIEAPDLRVWDDFMLNIVGAMAAPSEADTARHYRIDARAFRFRVETGATARLALVGWEMSDTQAFDAAILRLRAAGRDVEICSTAQAAQRQVTTLARSSDPAGHPFEIFVGAQNAASDFISAAGVSAFVTGENGRLGMGHIVYAALEFEALHHFYRDVMGFGESDLPRIAMGGPAGPTMGIAFMHAETGRHHSVAVIEMPPPPSGCIHVMVEAATLEDVGRAYDRQRAAGTPLSATLGKHTNDQVTSFYMATPAGFDLEFGWGGLVLDPRSWVATAHHEMDVWGHRWAWQDALQAAQ